jgi:glucokinase
MQRDMKRLVERGWKTRLPKLMKRLGQNRLTASVIERALTDGDDVMEKLIGDAEYYVGLLVAGLVNVLDPEVVVIGGGIAERLGESFVAPIRRHAYKHFFAQRDRERVRIVSTELGDRAAPLGAAIVARTRLAQLDSTALSRQGTATWLHSE